MSESLIPTTQFSGGPEFHRTATVHAQRDAGVTRITRNAARRQRQTLMRVLTRAKKQREIRSDADLDSMADFFESTLAGIRMAAKAGKSRHALRNIAAFASRAYMASDRRITPE
jgi:hypothetical protein